MKHKPPEYLLGNGNSQTPACDIESNFNTQNCVFFSMQKNVDDLLEILPELSSEVTIVYLCKARV